MSATNVARAGKRGNISVGNNVSATMCPRLPVPYHFGPVRVRILLQHYRVMADAQAPVEAAVPAAQALVQASTSGCRS